MTVIVIHYHHIIIITLTLSSHHHNHRSLSSLTGGGAVALNSRGSPSDSRLILAADSMVDAIEWKEAIEKQIM